VEPQYRPRDAECTRACFFDSEKIFFQKNLTHEVGEPLGIKVGQPTMIKLQDDKTSTFVDALSRSLSRSGLQCVVCVLPTPNKERYDAIKKTCSVDLPIPSQCVTAKSLSKKQALMSVCTKIMQQINCKLGGQLWRLEIPLTKTMIVGVDVCHDTSRSSGGRQSVAGFCATMNPTYTKYYSRVTFQGAGQEIVDGLKVCMIESLRKFYSLNQFLPERIIIYRDGVGDGMLQAVVDHEIPQINETFATFQNYKPSLAIIIVKKRVHTRIFHRSGHGGHGGHGGRGGHGGHGGHGGPNGHLNNPYPGTVVDSGCVHQGWYDFFLVSQSVRQGTVTPTSYHVVYDTSRLNPDHIQRLTYKLCHLYYNWPGTIRVPAPCHYAHKIAFLVGQSIHKEPSDTLRDKLYFL